MSKTEELDCSSDDYGFQDFSDSVLASLDMPDPDDALLWGESQQSELLQDDRSEYDEYDFSEFTAEDFARIDELIRAGTEIGGPRVVIELEGPQTDHDLLKDTARAVAEKPLPSPFAQFRKGGRFSVTDLVGPAWCEVQFDYGLRGMRWLPLEVRPQTFVSESGKTIEINNAAAKKRDKILKKGEAVHKKLEQELRPVMVEVAITSREEKYATRLVQMVNCLIDLQYHGFCREMPIVGVVHGEFVTGIIDEIQRRPVFAEDPTVLDSERRLSRGPNKRSSSSSPAKSKRKRKQNSPAQTDITKFFMASSPVSSPESSHRLLWTLHVSDTKTRHHPSMPPEEDTLPARLQLMLYHRILSSFLAASSPSPPSDIEPFDFAIWWEKLKLNPTATFSDQFMQDSGLKDAPKSFGHKPDSLERLATWFQSVAATLNIDHIDKTLSLVYRSRATKRAGSWSRRESSVPTEEVAKALQAGLNETPALYGGGDDALSRAIAASLADAPPSYDGSDDGLARAIAASLEDSVTSGRVAEGDLGILTGPVTHGQHAHTSATAHAEMLEADPELAWALQQSVMPKLLEKNPLRDVLDPVASSASEDDIEVATRSTQSGVANVPGRKRKTKRAKKAVSAATVRTVTDIESSSEESTSKIGDSSAEEDTDRTMLAKGKELAVSDIIGTKEFDMDDALLDNHLTSVLEWWHGRRPPRGVEVENTRRCLSCEYLEGCEWREQKAIEATERARENGLRRLLGK